MSTYTFDPIADSLTLGFGTAYPADILIANGVKSPGIFKATGGAVRKFKWDTQNAQGAQGWIIWYRGWEPTADIGCTFTFWDKGQIKEFYENFLPIFELDGRKRKPSAVDVYHPIWAANDITKVALVEIGELTPEPDQRWTISLKFLEYREVKQITAKKASGATGTPAKPTVEDKLDARIAAEEAKMRQPL